MIQLDVVDRGILAELQRESRSSYAEIGKAVGLSPAAVHDRVKKLERKDVIRAYRIQVNPDALGLSLTCFIFVELERGSSGQKVLPFLSEITEIEELHSVAGDLDLVLKVRTTNTRSLEELVYRIKGVSGVAKTTTRIVLSTKLEGRPLVPID